MKRGSLLLTFALLLVSMSLAVAEDGGDWFDMKNCVFCKNISAEPGLLEHMTTEYHHLDNGYISITAVTPEYHEAYVRMQQAMQKTAEGMMSAKSMPPMCPHCIKYGELMMTPGIKTQSVSTFAGDIMMMTSDNADQVRQLQAFADKTAEAGEKMHKTEKSE